MRVDFSHISLRNRTFRSRSNEAAILHIFFFSARFYWPIFAIVGRL